jgi:hypothetical protein
MSNVPVHRYPVVYLVDLRWLKKIVLDGGVTGIHTMTITVLSHGHDRGQDHEHVWLFGIFGES